MAGQKDERKYYPIQFGGVLDESRSPTKVGGTGLTSASNLTYRRYGSWGKRGGSGIAYAAPAAGPNPGSPTSGIRWYRGAPTPLTRLVVSAQGNLYTGGDPNLVSPFAPLSIITTAPNNSGLPASFAAAYDPSDNGYTGSDILIIAGLTGPFGFATGNITFSGLPNPGDIFGVTVQTAVAPVFTFSVSYKILPSDTLASAVQALSTLINTSSLVNAAQPFPPLGQSPAINQTYITQANNGVVTLHLGSLVGGVAGSGNTGNNLQYFAFHGSGTTPVSSPTVATNMAGGGATVSAPLKYDGVSVTGLSSMIQQPFTSTVTWHNHVWFWGDPANPDTLYAADINQPTGFAFMLQFGGYQIGQGDGDPTIQMCIPIGNILYVFKRSSIYAITGYDFQSGEYQFSVQLALNGTGIPAPGCAALTHNNTIIYWDGAKFYRLTVGAFIPEYIGRTIPLTSGAVANGNPNLMRAVSGDFPVLTTLDNSYPGGVVVNPNVGTTMFSNVVLFACDVGNGYANVVLVYDDDASNFIGDYAWSQWNGWNVAAWIPFGSGKDAAQTAADTSALFWIPALPSTTAVIVNEYGVSPTQDGFNSLTPTGIPWLAKTGWDAFETPVLLKELHRLFLTGEANPGANIRCAITASGPVNGSAQTTYPSNNVVFPPTVGPIGTESNQTLEIGVKPYLRGYKYMIALSEPGASAEFEVSSLLGDYIEQPFES